MKKILTPLVALLLFSACNYQNKRNNEALTKRIENLQKDSTEYSQLKAKIDSLKKQNIYQDSLREKQNLCEVGECCVKIATELKAYAHNKMSYSKLGSSMSKLNELIYIVSIPDKLREQLLGFVNQYREGVSQVSYMHNSVNSQMSGELWLEIYYAKSKKLQKLFCNP